MDKKLWNKDQNALFPGKIQQARLNIIPLIKKNVVNAEKFGGHPRHLYRLLVRPSVRPYIYMSSVSRTDIKVS